MVLGVQLEIGRFYTKNSDWNRGKVDRINISLGNLYLRESPRLPFRVWQLSHSTYASHPKNFSWTFGILLHWLKVYDTYFQVSWWNVLLQLIGTRDRLSQTCGILGKLHRCFQAILRAIALSCSDFALSATAIVCC